MAIAIEETVTGGADGNPTSVVLPSWTPSDDDLIVVFVSLRTFSAPPHVDSISGNGGTFTMVYAHDDAQNQIAQEVWVAKPASASSGSLTISMDGVVRVASVQAVRFSGADSIEASNSSDTGATDTNAPSTSITTLSANALVMGFCTHRVGTAFSVGSGFTANVLDVAFGSGGDAVRASTEYLIKASAGAQTVNGTISSSLDWVMGAVSIAEASAGGGTFTGDIAQTLPSLQQDTSGTFDPPVYEGDIAQTLPLIQQDATGTAADPIYEGTAGQTLGAIEQDASGTFTAPQLSGDITSILGALEQDATGTFVAPVDEGSISQTLPLLEQQATGEVTVPVFEGSAAQTLGLLTQNATGTTDVPPSFTGSIEQTLPALTQFASHAEIIIENPGYLDIILPGDKQFVDVQTTQDKQLYVISIPLDAAYVSVIDSAQDHFSVSVSDAHEQYYDISEADFHTVDVVVD